jgi:hypothetical protein
MFVAEPKDGYILYSTLILWHVDPLLYNDREICNNTTVTAK